MATEQPKEVLRYSFQVDANAPSYLKRTMPIFIAGEDEIKVSPVPDLRAEVTISDSENTAAMKIAAKCDVAGSYGAFSGSASMSASHENKTEVKTTRVDKEVMAIKYSVQAGAQLQLTPEKFLDPAVADFIKTKSAEDLCTLGEFYAYQADLGGLFKKTHIVEMTQKDSATSIAAEVAGKAGGIIGSVSASAQTSVEVREGTKNAKAKSSWQCQGGNPMIWLGCTGDNSDEIQAKWADSVADANLYVYNLKLKPIWELVGKVDKKKGQDLEKLLMAKWKANIPPIPGLFAEMADGETVVYIEEYTTKYPFLGNLVKAEYGVFEADNRPQKAKAKDVTRLVNIKGTYIVNNEVMQGDPAPGPRKELKLTFAGNAICRIPESGWVTRYTGSVKEATWGCGSKRRDVTGNITQGLKATNEALGCDPAPGDSKTLEIVYSGGR